MYIDDIYIYILYLYYLCIQYMYIYILVGGFKPSDKYEFVSWDDDIPQTTNQTNTCIVLGMYSC
jgi:DUF1680 family protein